MAQEMVNRLMGAAKVAADGTFIARSGNVALINHVPNSGVYEVLLTEGIAGTEFCVDTCLDAATRTADIMVRQLTVNEFEVRAAAPTNPFAPLDVAFNICVHRLSSSNGT